MNKYDFANYNSLDDNRQLLWWFDEYLRHDLVFFYPEKIVFLIERLTATNYKYPERYSDNIYDLGVNTNFLSLNIIQELNISNINLIIPASEERKRISIVYYTLTKFRRSFRELYPGLLNENFPTDPRQKYQLIKHHRIIEINDQEKEITLPKVCKYSIVISNIENTEDDSLFLEELISPEYLYKNISNWKDSYDIFKYETKKSYYFRGYNNSDNFGNFDNSVRVEGEKVLFNTVEPFTPFPLLIESIQYNPSYGVVNLNLEKINNRGFGIRNNRCREIYDQFIPAGGYIYKPQNIPTFPGFANSTLVNNNSRVSPFNIFTPGPPPSTPAGVLWRFGSISKELSIIPFTGTRYKEEGLRFEGPNIRGTPGDDTYLVEEPPVYRKLIRAKKYNDLISYIVSNEDFLDIEINNISYPTNINPIYLFNFDNEVRPLITDYINNDNLNSSRKVFSDSELAGEAIRVENSLIVTLNNPDFYIVGFFTESCSTSSSCTPSSVATYKIYQIGKEYPTVDTIYPRQFLVQIAADPYFDLENFLEVYNQVFNSGLINIDLFYNRLTEEINKDMENNPFGYEIMIQEIHAALGADEFAYDENGDITYMNVARNVQIIMEALGLYYNLDGTLKNIEITPTSDN